MKKHLIIIRGLPSAGKSTVAEYLANMYGYDTGYTVCTADDYFMKDGKYMFDVSKLGAAHMTCQAKCEKALESGEERVIVANTNTTEKELNTYMKLGKKYGYIVFSLIVENRHGGKNSHNVPDTTLDRMRERFDIKLL